MENLENHIPAKRERIYIDGKLYTRDKNGNYKAERKKPRQLKDSNDAFPLLAHLGKEEQEVYAVIVLDAQHTPISVHEVSKGLVNSGLAHPRETFKEAIRRNGVSVIIAHNHPSGNPEVSEADKETTKRMVKSGKILGIPVLDHLIILKNDFVSIRLMYRELFEV